MVEILGIASSATTKEIAIVAVVWQVIGAISMTSNINIPILHQKLHDMYNNITSVMYGPNVDRT